MNYIILIFIAGCGVVLGVFLARRKGCGLMSEPFNCIQGKQSKKKAENKEKILLALRNSNGEFLESNGKITNNDVEKMCGVSHATAERYLNEIEKDGEIIQHGKIGTSVFYTLK